MHSQKFDRAATGGLQEHHTPRFNWNAPYLRRRYPPMGGGIG